MDAGTQKHLQNTSKMLPSHGYSYLYFQKYIIASLSKIHFTSIVDAGVFDLATVAPSLLHKTHHHHHHPYKTTVLVFEFSSVLLSLLR